MPGGCKHEKKLNPVKIKKNWNLINYVIGECKQNICLANRRGNTKTCVQSVSMEKIK